MDSYSQYTCMGVGAEGLFLTSIQGKQMHSHQEKEKSVDFKFLWKHCHRKFFAPPKKQSSINSPIMKEIFMNTA